jgi:hypothetical protein
MLDKLALGKFFLSTAVSPDNSDPTKCSYSSVIISPTLNSLDTDSLVELQKKNINT